MQNVRFIGMLLIKKAMYENDEKVVFKMNYHYMTVIPSGYIPTYTDLWIFK